MKRQAWFFLAASFSITLVFALSLEFLPPIIPVMRSALGLSAGQAGIMMSSLALFGIVVSPIAGHMGDRWGARKLGLTGLAVATVFQLCFAVSRSFPMLVVSRLFMGIGSSTLSILGAQIVTQYFSGTPFLGAAMGVWNAAVPLGIVISQLIFSRLAVQRGWQAPVFIIFIFSAVVLAAYFLFFPRQPETSVAHPPIAKALRRLDRRVWLLGISWMLWNAGCMILVTFVNDLLTTRGVSIQHAGLLAAMLELFPVIASPWLGHRMDLRRTHRLGMVVASLGYATLSLLMITLHSSVLPFILGISLCFALGPMAIFGFAPAFLTSENSGIGYGILNSTMNIGVLVGPALGGLLHDVTGNYLLSFIVGALFVCAGAGAIACIRPPGRS